MRLYAATPVRRTRQIIADLLFVGWIVLWAWIGGLVHDATAALAAPGLSISESAGGLGDALDDAGDRLQDVPVVGDELSAPFDSARDAADGIAAAGLSTAETVQDLALWLGWTTAAVPILIWAAVYLPVRYRFIRRATAGQRFIDANEDLDLFALRALASQPMHVLARISDDPAGGWRNRDPQIIEALGTLELRDSGLLGGRRIRSSAD